MRTAIVILSLVLASPASAASGNDVRADSLLASARTLIARGDVTSRIAGFRALEGASHVAPKRADVWLAFGRAATGLGRPERALSCFDHATRLAPDDAAAWAEVGGASKEAWLMRCDRASLVRARSAYQRAVKLDPQNPATLTALATMHVLMGEPRKGLEAGLKANVADPRDPLPMLAVGAALFRVGALALADSAFRAAERRLEEPLAGRVRGDGYAWIDPDLTTSENEARLDYQTRCALVIFLFGDGDVVRWDERAELFVRYGPPGSVEFNPAWAQHLTELEFVYAPDAVRPKYAPMPVGFPYDVQEWHYPELGMHVELWDRFLTRQYQLPYSREIPLEPSPDPALLATRTDLVVVDGGRAVFHARPPNAKPYPLTASYARFPAGQGVRMLGSVSAARSDSAWGAWALADSTGHVVARETRRLDASACSAKNAFGSFAADVTPGFYRVDFSVWDGRGRRGVEHLDAVVVRTVNGPRLSDLVLLCGAPDLARLEPEFAGRVAGTQLTLYCEIDGLLASSARPAQFVYRTRIYALDRHGRRAERPAYDATREEQNVGAHRRQFVTAPVRELPAGRYELVLEVTDRASESTAARTVRFERS